MFCTQTIRKLFDLPPTKVGQASALGDAFDPPFDVAQTLAVADQGEPGYPGGAGHGRKRTVGAIGVVSALMIRGTLPLRPVSS